MNRTSVIWWMAALFIAAMLDVTTALAGSEKVLYSFGSSSATVAEPYASLLADSQGNL